jgi:hypothetical protein
VIRRSSRVFTTDEAAVRWRCSGELATDILVDFVLAGFVEKVGADRWTVTRKGYGLACNLSTFDERVAA